MPRLPEPATCVLIDNDQPWTGAPGVVMRWSTLNARPGEISIPGEVERRSLDLRREYLAWVHDLGNSPVHGVPLRTHLRVYGGLSAWWMSRVAQKEPLNSEAVYTVFKLRALELAYAQAECRALVYVGSDPVVDEILRAWSKVVGHPYEWRRVRAAPADELVSRLAWLPPAMRQVPVALRFLYRRWRERYRRATRTRIEKQSSQYAQQATIFTYFPNIDLAETRSGRFRSHYWEDLHRVLDDMPVTVNWVWVYAISDQCSFDEMLALRDTCNARDPGKYRHVVLEEFATPRAMLGAMWGFVRLVWQALVMGSQQRKFCLAGSALNFYPALREDWLASLFGQVALEGLLYQAICDNLVRQLGEHAWGLYIWENQPWELAVLAAWRKHCSGRIAGSQHTALRPLAMRSFADPRDYKQADADALPLPDVLAVNGQGARRLMQETGYPVERLCVTEALRYLHLSPAGRGSVSPVDGALLVITGYRPAEVRHQLRLLAAAARLGALNDYKSVLIKPHPFCPIKGILGQLGIAFEYALTDAPLSELWPKARAAYVANSTAAILEALYAGVPAAICAAENTMNYSPLYGDTNVPVVATAQSLRDWLAAPQAARYDAEYLMIDKRLERWKALLGADLSCADR